MQKTSGSDRNKIGNTVVYVAQHIDNLSKTKLLKLLFLMEIDARFSEGSVLYFNPFVFPDGGTPKPKYFTNTTLILNLN